MKKCDNCKKDITPEKSADGFNGFEKRTVIPEAPEKTRAEEVCKDCYIDFRKEKDPKFSL
jgi:hypothetical protein